MRFPFLPHNYCCLLAILSPFLLLSCEPPALSDWEKQKCSVEVAQLEVSQAHLEAPVTYRQNGELYTGCAIKQMDDQYVRFDLIDGLPERTRYFFRSNGALASDLETPKENGPSRGMYYYSDGKPKVELNYWGHQFNGYRREWFSNGQMQNEEYLLAGHRLYQQQWDSLGNSFGLEGNLVARFLVDTLTASGLGLAEWYDGQAPANIPPFWRLRGDEVADSLELTSGTPTFQEHPPRDSGGFGYYHGQMKISYLQTRKNSNAVFLGNLTPPMPGLPHFLLLVEGHGETHKLLDQLEYRSKMGVEHGPEIEYAEVRKPGQVDILLRWDDSVVGRHSETVSFYKTDGDSLVEYLSIRAWSQEGPAYRGDQTGADIWYEIERKWEFVDRDGDGVQEIEINGTVSICDDELNAGKKLVDFEESYTWDAEEKQFVCACFADWPWVK